MGENVWVSQQWVEDCQQTYLASMEKDVETSGNKQESKRYNFQSSGGAVQQGQCPLPARGRPLSLLHGFYALLSSPWSHRLSLVSFVSS